jgi:hypothetical protein
LNHFRATRNNQRSKATEIVLTVRADDYHHACRWGVCRGRARPLNAST